MIHADYSTSIFEFQFLVLARRQSEVAAAIISKLKEFAKDPENKFRPQELLIYSTTLGSTIGEHMNKLNGFVRDAPSSSEEEKKEDWTAMLIEVWRLAWAKSY